MLNKTTSFIEFETEQMFDWQEQMFGIPLPCETAVTEIVKNLTISVLF